MKDTEVDIPKKTPKAIVLVIVFALLLLVSLLANFSLMKDRDRVRSEGEASVEQAKAGTAKVQAALEASSNENTALRKELAETKGALAKSKAEVEEAKAATAAMAGQLTDAKAATSAVQSKLDESTARYGELLGQNEEAKAATAILKNQLEEAQAATASMQKQVDEARALANRQEMRAQRAESELAAARKPKK